MISLSEFIPFLRQFQDLSWHRFGVDLVSSVGMWCDAALRIIARKVFSSFWQSEGNGLLLSLSSISCVKLAQLAFLRLT